MATAADIMIGTANYTVNGHHLAPDGGLNFCRATIASLSGNHMNFEGIRNSATVMVLQADGK